MLVRPRPRGHSNGIQGCQDSSLNQEPQLGSSEKHNWAPLGTGLGEDTMAFRALGVGAPHHGYRAQRGLGAAVKRLLLGGMHGPHAL